MVEKARCNLFQSQYLQRSTHGRESSDFSTVTLADGDKVVQGIFYRERMFRKITVVKKLDSPELAQVICHLLERQLKTPCEKTDTHVYVWNFVLIDHDSNIDYVATKKQGFHFQFEKAKIRRLGAFPPLEF